MAIHNDLGFAGERAACRFLMKEGYRILETNWHHELYEIDIIARHKRHLVIVEVKSRKDDHLYDPLMAIDREKKKHIIHAANAYKRIKKIDAFSLRYDVIIAIFRPASGVFEISHYPDYFREIDIQHITGHERIF